MNKIKYRIGKKQNRALLDDKGQEVALFSKGQEDLAKITSELLNKFNNGVLDDVSEWFHCQLQIEDEERCEDQCDHCKEYYKGTDNGC